MSIHYGYVLHQKVSFKMGPFSNPEHTHPGNLILESPPGGRCHGRNLPAKGPFPYTRQRRAAAAAATHLNMYGIIITGLLPYMFKWVAAAAAARRCRVYGKGPLSGRPNRPRTSCNRLSTCPTVHCAVPSRGSGLSHSFIIAERSGGPHWPGPFGDQLLLFDMEGLPINMASLSADIADIRAMGSWTSSAI